jgi:hypothetical protein
MLRFILSASLFICSTAFAWAENVTTGTLDMQSARAELLDLSSKVSLVRQPQQTLDLADAMSAPELLAAAKVMSANPEVWLKAMEHAGATGVPQNISRVASPEMLADWFFSSIDPQYQPAILTRTLDPKNPQRGMQAMSDPRFFMPALAMMNPDKPMQWTKVASDGRMIQSMQALFDPKHCFKWMRLPMMEPSAAKRSGDKVLTPAPFLWKPPLRY